MKLASAIGGLFTLLILAIFALPGILPALGQDGGSPLPYTFDPEWNTKLSQKVFEGPHITWNGFNTIQLMTVRALEAGMPAGTVVLLLLLPLVATLVSFLHYVVGISGYGTFMPTVLAMVLLATGIPTGLIIFGLILLITVGTNWLLRPLRLHYWPVRSMTLLFISLFIFGLMLFSPGTPFFRVNTISIFSVLVMILLVEDFVRTQLAKSKREAKRLALGTLILSVVGAAVMSLWQVQILVLSYPELVVALVLVANWWIGRYSGIRVSEVARFRKAIRR